MQKKIIIFLLSILSWLIQTVSSPVFAESAGAFNAEIVPVASEENLSSGITVFFAAGLTGADTEFFRKLSHDADRLLLRIFRFHRGGAKNRLQIRFEPVSGQPSMEFNSTNGMLVLNCPGARELWQQKPEMLRKLLSSMVIASLGHRPDIETVACDWLWNGLAEILELPGAEDSIWRVGYYFGVQDAFLQGKKTEWERLLMLTGCPESRVEGELCRLLVETAKQLDTGSQRLMQDYVLLLLERNADNVSAFWSSVGFNISNGGKQRKSGLAVLDKKARELVFSRLSPLPAWKISSIFEEYGRSVLVAFDKTDDSISIEISGRWEDWPVWCRQYDMTNAAERMSMLLNELGREAPLLVVPALDAMQQELAAVANGKLAENAQWSTVLADVRKEIFRQQEIEAILFRLEERNPAINERLRTRLDALQKYEEFPLSTGFETLLEEAEAGLTNNGRK